MPPKQHPYIAAPTVAEAAVIDLVHGHGIDTADAAIDLLYVLARRFHLAVFCWTRVAVAAAVTPNDRVPHQLRREDLEPDEWDRLRATPAWASLPDDAIDHDRAAEVVCTAMRQAGLDCAHCGRPLRDPLEQSLGHCPDCRAAIGAATILAIGCPANGFHPHDAVTANPGSERADATGICRDCGTPLRRQHVQAAASSPAGVEAWQWVAARPR